MITIICIEPEVAGNLGAIARVMGNFGFESLCVINPAFRLDNGQLVARAKHAYSIIEKAKVLKIRTKDIFPTLKKEFDYLVGTTAMVGTDFNLTRSPISAETLALKILGEHTLSDLKVGLILGREGSGLFNLEIKSCDFVVSIPASTNYPTLNISHALSILLYELFKEKTRLIKKNSMKKQAHNLNSKEINSKTSISHISFASGEEKDNLVKRYSELINALEFETASKKNTQISAFRRIVGKSFFTKREVYILHGFISKVLEKLNFTKK
jgi:TrmH family RNA methyltransferase